MTKLDAKSGVFANRMVSEDELISGEIREHGDAFGRAVDVMYRAGMTNAELASAANSNRACEYRLSYICPDCSLEHRVTMGFDDAFLTAQRLILMGHPVVAIVASDEAQTVTPDEVQPSEDLTLKLEELLRHPPKGNA